MCKYQGSQTLQKKQNPGAYNNSEKSKNFTGKIFFNYAAPSCNIHKF